ncbi:fusaric acid resistance-like protein [Rhizoctonia solani]|uniref:Fusaric acid resistance-like protein n=1 Tax=Rhizoctonia solani TaxID=456999 RepID=A0A8H8T4V0_9AGAM|nr:fusaric acid resistance-like protein [Rhizoctonia solani]QRW27748.1 fusaric acid resistance-like protein [Rhizoctonia solani]
MPRLILACRAVSFIGIWLIARAPETGQWDYNLTQLLFAFGVAGAASLVVSLIARIFTHPGGYAKDVLDVLEALKDLVQSSTSQTLFDNDKPASQTESLHTKSLDKALALHTSYAYSAYELRIGRVPIKAIKPLLITINRVREELAWGRVPALEGTETPLEIPCYLLNWTTPAGGARRRSLIAYLLYKRPLDVNSNDPLAARTAVTNARVVLKTSLDSVVHEINKACTLKRTERHHKELFRKSLHCAALLHISSELIRALTLAHGILTIHQTSRLHIFFLRPSWFWLGMSPRSVIEEEDSPGTVELRSAAGPDTSSSAEKSPFEDPHTTLLPTPTTAKSTPKWSLSTITHTPTILRARIQLSNWIWKARNSKHIQFAFKHALGIAILMIPALLPETSSGKQFYNSSYGVWAIISFVYVIEPNTALTWRVGIWRVFGTGIGALYAYITWQIAGTNPYGVVALITAAEIIITWFVRSSTPGVGIVASVTIPPVLFIPYLGVAEISMLHLTALRALQISIGIVAAILIDHIFFPKRPRAIFLSGMAKVIEDVRVLHSELSSRTHNNTPHGSPKSGVEVAQAQTCSAKLELRIRKLVMREKICLGQMEHELSLMPKPTESYRMVTGYVQRLVDLTSGLRRIRENVPHMAIDTVLVQRQRVDSCITLALYACEHAFRSRRALPQGLPSPRKALDVLNIELMDALQSQGRATDIGYAMAENEVIDEMVRTVEGLVKITRDLFGTRAWLNGVDNVHLGVGF